MFIVLFVCVCVCVSVERKRRERKRRNPKRPIKRNGLAHDQALLHLGQNLSLNQNLPVKMQSCRHQIRPPNQNPRVQLVWEHLHYLTLSLRWRIRSATVPKTRKEAPAGRPKKKRALKEDEADQDHPDRSQDTDQDPDLPNGIGDQNRHRDLETVPERGLIKRERKVDRPLEDGTIGPDLVRLEDAGIQGPGHVQSEVDRGLV